MWRSSEFSICATKGAEKKWDEQHPHPQCGNKQGENRNVILHKSTGFLVEGNTCLLSIRPSAPCTKPTSDCPEHPAADPVKPTPKFTCLEGPTGLVTAHMSHSLWQAGSWKAAQGRESCGGGGCWTTTKSLSRSSYQVSAEVVEWSHFSSYLSRKSSLLLRRHNYVSRAF